MAAHSITVLGDMLREAAELLPPHPTQADRRVERLRLALNAPGLGELDFSDYMNIADMVDEIEKNHEDYVTRIPRVADLVHFINRALIAQVAKWDDHDCPTKYEDWG